MCRGRRFKVGSGEPDRRGGPQADHCQPARRAAGTVSAGAGWAPETSGSPWLHIPLPAHSGTIPSMKLGELATRLGAELRGDAELEVTGVKGIEEAGPTEVTFVANPPLCRPGAEDQAAAVLVEPEFQRLKRPRCGSRTPIWPFRGAGLFYQPPAYAPGIHPTAVIDPRRRSARERTLARMWWWGPQVKLGAHATLLPHVVLYPGVEAGSHFFAHAHAVVRENCILGDHVTLENGAIIGADGFGFRQERGRPLGEDSAVGSGAAGQPGGRAGQRLHRPGHGGRDRNRRRDQGGQSGPDRPRLAGGREHAALRADRGLAGSSVIGNNAILAGQAGVAGHCTWATA
jgi:UDP-3-O-[3-hydroxymyristoyl] glucosamine N-acyltransferase